MTKITVTVATTNPALKASLREPTIASFNLTPRGLKAATKWASDTRRDLVTAQGNLSYPRTTVAIGEVAVDRDDWDALQMEIANVGEIDRGALTPRKATLRDATEWFIRAYA